MLRNPNGLSYAVVSLLGLVMAVDVFSVAVTFAERTRFLGPDGGLSDPGSPGVLGIAMAGLLQTVLLVATGIVFIVWFHRLRKNAEVWASGLQTKSPGWAIGGWFIPVGNLWIPRGIAADIWRASRPDPFAPDGAGELRPLNAWWGVWVLATMVSQVASRIYAGAETRDEILSGFSWLIASDLLDIAAAVLAILFVRRLTSMQHAKATGMISASQ